VGALGQVSFFVALVIVIVIHEAAHFAMARAFGIKVNEFFVGFGPKIWSTMRGETEFGFKWIPAGGYVKIAGMSPYETVAPEDLPRTYGAKPRWQRALVIVAGPATHFVLAFVCFALWLGLVGQSTTNSPLITAVDAQLEGDSSPAVEAGLRPGDRIVGVDDLVDPTTNEVLAHTQARVGEPITFTIEREGERFSVEIVPVLTDDNTDEEFARIGVQLGEGRRETTDVIGAVSEGGRLVGENLVSTVRSVGRIFGPEGIGRVFELAFTDAPRQDEDVSSVVGVGRFAGSLASEGRFGDILFLFAYVNVFVGFLNLLPLPPFDGGHLALLAVEKVLGRPLDMRKVVPISAAVAAFLILFTIAVVYVDIVKPPV
jgi:membrane-associated protease RseP (regulator of RpoE activity)